MQVYQVGGVVRDKLLGLPIKDCDWVVVGGSVEELLALGYTPVGKDFPVFLHPETREEYALARTERKTGRGYSGFSVYAAADVTLEADLLRRDLTINAMALDANGLLIDPFHGQADLQAGILRHVSPAFVEDPVRILRVARFAARYDFEVAAETVDLMREMVVNGEVDALVPERVWQETMKALHEPYPARFIEELRRCGALARIFPEIDCLFGVPQPPQHHPEVDTGVHILLCLQQARKMGVDGQVMFAVLLHDLGKGLTPKHILPHHYGHEAGGVPVIKQLCERYRVPTHYRELAVLLARYHTHCHSVFSLNPRTIFKTFNEMDAFRRPSRFLQFLQGCEADARGRTGLENRDYPQAAYFQTLLTAAQEVQAKEIVAEGFTGVAVGKELDKRRLWRIRKAVDMQALLRDSA